MDKQDQASGNGGLLVERRIRERKNARYADCNEECKCFHLDIDSLGRMLCRTYERGSVMPARVPGESSRAADPLDKVRSRGLRACVESYPLTKREREIVLMVLHGKSNKEIARSCSIGEQTVKDHLKHVYGKIGVHQRTALYAKILWDS